MTVNEDEVQNIENRMIRYRYGPWDPSYFSVLGRLIGKGLVQVVPAKNGMAYRITEAGHQLAMELIEEESWQETWKRIELLKSHFDLTGNSLKNFIYTHFPEVTGASWGEEL